MAFPMATYFANEQYPPEAACLEPAAISGGSWAWSTAGECARSQVRRASSRPQKRPWRSRVSQVFGGVRTGLWLVCRSLVQHEISAHLGLEALA